MVANNSQKSKNINHYITKFYFIYTYLFVSINNEYYYKLMGQNIFFNARIKNNHLQFFKSFTNNIINKNKCINNLVNLSYV